MAEAQAQSIAEDFELDCALIAEVIQHVVQAAKELGQR